MYRLILILMVSLAACSHSPVVSGAPKDKTGEDGSLVGVFDAVKISDGVITTNVEPACCATLDKNLAGSVIGLSSNGHGRIVLRDNSGIVVQLDAENGGSLMIKGRQVIGPRLAAIEDAKNPEDMVIKFNLLLAAMRQHGLIETSGTGLAAESGQVERH